MKNIKYYLLLLIASVLQQACMPIYNSRAKTAATRDIENSTIVHKPVVADLEIKDKKVTGNAGYSKQTLEYVKNMAIADALRNADADVLLEPQFDIETTNDIIKVEVKGYPATYKNFKPYEAKDTLWEKNNAALKSLRIGNQTEKKTTTAALQPQQYKKKTHFAAACAGTLVIAGILSLVVALTGY